MLKLTETQGIPCDGCLTSFDTCQAGWRRQRKCCPGCTHGAGFVSGRTATGTAVHAIYRRTWDPPALCGLEAPVGQWVWPPAAVDCPDCLHMLRLGLVEPWT